jgi:hypothetical protein
VSAPEIDGLDSENNSNAGSKAQHARDTGPMRTARCSGLTAP